jgi:hypothetical protein
LRYRLIADKAQLAETLASGGPRKAEPGDFVAIHYRGKSAMDDGTEAASYRVAVDKAPDETPVDVEQAHQETDDGDIPF